MRDNLHTCELRGKANVRDIVPCCRIASPRVTTDSKVSALIPSYTAPTWGDAVRHIFEVSPRTFPYVFQGNGTVASGVSTPRRRAIELELGGRQQAQLDRACVAKGSLGRGSGSVPRSATSVVTYSM